MLGKTCLHASANTHTHVHMSELSWQLSCHGDPTLSSVSQGVCLQVVAVLHKQRPVQVVQREKHRSGILITSKQPSERKARRKGNTAHGQSKTRRPPCAISAQKDLKKASRKAAKSTRTAPQRNYSPWPEKLLAGLGRHTGYWTTCAGNVKRLHSSATD